jgi:pimeloyl-ACP methyl ester carboxylesterase
MLSACVSPAKRLDHQAESLGLRSGTTVGGGFPLRYYYNAAAAAQLSGAPAEPLHVYLEGDGRPWRYGYPARDPTAKLALALELMAQDSAPAFYLGRPCYMGMHETACRPELWTDGRYSETVVNSMVAALRQLLGGNRSGDLVLVGYSGGGALAVLLSTRLKGVSGVITLAANLDIDRWADLHRYTPLTQSLNPIEVGVAPLVRYSHLVGEGDDNVTPDIVAGFVRRHGGDYRSIGGYDHLCCWRRDWQALLQQEIKKLTTAVENPR